MGERLRLSCFFKLCLIAFAICHFEVADATASIFFESATVGQTGVTAGSTVNAEYFLGVRFFVEHELQVGSVGGHLYGGFGAPDLFVAILRLSSWEALPSPGSPFQESELVMSKVFKAPVGGSADVVVPMNVTLPIGPYGLVFGSGALGANGWGTMPHNGTVVEDPRYFIRWSDGQWFNLGGRGERFVVYDGSDPGDYNEDGLFNSADYTVWRDNLGDATLPNRDPLAAGPVGQSDYVFWKAHFAAPGSGSIAASVPEPSALLLLAISGLGILRLRRR